MKIEKREFGRKKLEPLPLQGIISVNGLTPITQGGRLVQASASGFRVEVHRNEFCDPKLRKNLNISHLEGCSVSIYIPSMDLDVTGKIVRTKYRGDSLFELGIDYTWDAPRYWRECLCDLLPAPGEVD